MDNFEWGYGYDRRSAYSGRLRHPRTDLEGLGVLVPRPRPHEHRPSIEAAASFLTRAPLSPGPPGRLVTFGCRSRPAASRVSVVPWQVIDDERRDRRPGLTVGLEGVGGPLAQDLVQRCRCRHEVRPVEERPGHRQPVVAQDASSSRTTERRTRSTSADAGVRSEVGAEPADRRPGTVDLGEVAVRLQSSGYFTAPEVRRRPDASAAAGSRRRSGR